MRQLLWGSWLQRVW